MEENNAKVSPTESYLLKRVKELEKENKELKKEHKLYIETCNDYNMLRVLVGELVKDFELQTEESETFDYLRFDGSFFKVLYKDNERNSSGEQHLINFLNYVKVNL